MSKRKSLKDFKGPCGTPHTFVDDDPIYPLPVVEQRPERTLLPIDAEGRKNIPIVRGCFDYFPAALAEVARISKAGNDQHNPGQEIHWSRGKSTDQADAIGRHLLERGGVDTDGTRHSAKLAWRALALLQIELEMAGAPPARGAKGTVPPELLTPKR